MATSTRMCLQNDISATSSDAHIYRNIYLFIVVITHVMHIHRSSNQFHDTEFLHWPGWRW